MFLGAPVLLVRVFVLCVVRACFALMSSHVSFCYVVSSWLRVLIWEVLIFLFEEELF